MSSPIEVLNEKIDTDKEILAVLPKNTKKNVDAYIKKVQEIHKNSIRKIQEHIEIAITDSVENEK